MVHDASVTKLDEDTTRCVAKMPDVISRLDRPWPGAPNFADIRSVKICSFCPFKVLGHMFERVSIVYLIAQNREYVVGRIFVCIPAQVGAVSSEADCHQ